MEDEAKSNLLGLQTVGRKTISSRYTRLMTIIPSTLLAFFSVGGMLMVLFSGQLSAEERCFNLFFYLILLPLAFLSCWFSSKLKSVSLDEMNLYITRRRQEVKVPLSQVEHVRAWPGGCVRVRLRQPSEFGRSVWFMGKYDPFLFFSAHPVVGELRVLVEECRKKSGPEC